MMFTVDDSYLTGAAELCRAYAGREDLSTDAILVNFRILPLLFEGELEKAYSQTELIASESLREDLQCELLELLIKSLPEFDETLGDFYKSEAGIFSTWFMGRNLNRKMSLIRELILRAIWGNQLQMSIHWIRLLVPADNRLAAKVEGAIHLLVSEH